jgi:hypothetical protein
MFIGSLALADCFLGFVVLPYYALLYGAVDLFKPSEEEEEFSIVVLSNLEFLLTKLDKINVNATIFR